MGHLALDRTSCRCYNLGVFGMSDFSLGCGQMKGACDMKSTKSRVVTGNGKLFRDGIEVAEVDCQLTVTYVETILQVQRSDTIERGRGPIHNLEGTLTVTTARAPVSDGDDFIFQFRLDGESLALPVALTRLAGDGFQVRLQNVV